MLFELMELLEQAGHECPVFSTKHPQNRPSQYARYFIDRLENYNQLGIRKILPNMGELLKGAVYSPEARRKVERLIDDIRPDIGHVHVIDHWISPSVLYGLRSKGIPIVKSVNDHKLVCPNYLLYNPNTGKVCEKCIDGNYYHCFVDRCHKNSIASSALLSTAMYFHKWMGVYQNLVDIYMVSNRHKRDTLIRAGYDPSKIRLVPHPINLKVYNPESTFENYFLYFGRFTQEKGLMTLLKAMKKIPEIKLALIGAGPQEQELVSFARAEGLANVVFHGPKWGEDLKPFIAKARFIVVPSEWYEGAPMAIYQSLAMGKAVIGAEIGGIPDAIIENVNGLLFKPGDSIDLGLKIKSLWHNVSRTVEMGKKGREIAEREFSTERYYKRIKRIYDDLLGRS